MSEKQPKTCIFKDCHNPVSKDSEHGLCDKHLSKAKWQTLFMEHDEKTGMIWIHKDA